jgi:hypothetical protein
LGDGRQCELKQFGFDESSLGCLHADSWHGWLMERLGLADQALKI